MHATSRSEKTFGLPLCMYSYLLKECKHTLILPKPKYIMIHIGRLKWWGGVARGGGETKTNWETERQRQPLCLCVNMCNFGIIGFYRFSGLRYSSVLHWEGWKANGPPECGFTKWPPQKHQRSFSYSALGPLTLSSPHVPFTVNLQVKVVLPKQHSWGPLEAESDLPGLHRKRGMVERRRCCDNSGFSFSSFSPVLSNRPSQQGTVVSRHWSVYQRQDHNRSEEKTRDSTVHWLLETKIRA